MSESKFTRSICNGLAKYGAIVFPVVAGKMSQPGWPDRYVHHRLWQGWFEFKGEGGVLSKIQAHRIRELNRIRPGSAYVVREPDRVEDAEGRLLFTFDNPQELISCVAS